MDLKLRIANEVKYPLIVVSYDEKIPISENLTLGIVDGIIGQVLAQLYSNIVIKERIKEYSHEFEHLPPDEQQEPFQQIIIDTEVDAEFMWDPILQEASNLWRIVRNRGLGVGEEVN